MATNADPRPNADAVANADPPASSSATAATTPRRGGAGLPAVRIGLFGGLVGMLCCAGPTVLALLGVLSAGTAYVWAEDLYGGYSWWSRAAGLAVTAGLVVVALRRRRMCSLAGARTARWRLLLVAGVAVGTYAVLYAVTTLAGAFAH